MTEPKPRATPRRLERAVHRFVQQDSARAADLPKDKFFATVTGTSPLTVQWRGSQDPLPARRGASYTPAVNDWVACVLIDSQIFIIDRSV